MSVVRKLIIWPMLHSNKCEFSPNFFETNEKRKKEDDFFHC
jgi:hypothetical protein